MGQFPAEQRIFMVLHYNRTQSLVAVAHVFRQRFPHGENPLIPVKTMVCVEEEEQANVSSLSGESIVVILYSLYFIFPISYPNEQKDFLSFWIP